MNSQENSLVEPLLEPLTRREREILALLHLGYSAPEIAEQLTLAVSSVKWHIQHLYGKLGVNSKRQALTRAQDLGLLEKFSPTAEPQSRLSPTGRTFGPYHLLEKLGTGGMADVYKAYQPRLERYVALKFIRPERLAEPGFIARFEREARLLARFNHPNIVHIYDFGEDAAAGPLTQCYLAMELVAGQTLAEWLKVQGRPMTLDEALLILRQVSAALDAAHAQHIVHLDVKPSNIMLTPDGRALLSDFGLSRLVQTDPKNTDSLVTSGTPHYMSPEQVAGDVARIGVASDVYAVGIVTYEMLTGRVPFLGEPDHPVLLQHLQDPVPSPRSLNPQLPEAAEAVLFKALAKDPTERYPHAGDFTAALAEGASPALAVPAAWPTVTLDEAPAPGAGAPPFKGLHYFDEADADLFFGREVLTARLVQGLNDERFLAVVGASGSGKSSVVRAGVVPALRQSGAYAAIHIVTPTAHPLEALAVRLTRDSERVTDTANLLDDLTNEPRTLYLWAQRLLAERQLAGQTVLFVIDQFEETFTLCHDEVERRAFIDNLMTAVSASSEVAVGGIKILLTLRADFYAYCGPYPELRDWLAARQEYIGPMTADELRVVMERPAAHGAWTFEPGLVELLLKDVGAVGEQPAEPGALPLLSHALLETWGRRRGRTLTFGGYTASGGVRGAIAKTADAVYNRLDPDSQAIARKIFLRLTELGEGTQDTRRREQISNLKTHDSNAVQAVLKILADARLITTSEDTVDVAHEALIREWPTLREWLNENRDGLRLHRQLSHDANEWQKLNHDAGMLYRGARLAQTSEWAEWGAGSRSVTELNALEREFLVAAKEQAEREEAEREAQRQRELEAAQILAATEKQAAARMRTRNRVITGVGALAFLAALIAVFFSLQSNRNLSVANWNAATAQAANTQSAQNLDTANQNAMAAQAASTQAVEQTKLGHVREMVARAQAELGQSHITGLLLVAEAQKQAEQAGQSVAAVEQVLRNALANSSGLPLVGHTAVIKDSAFSSTGRWVATASGDNTVQVWDMHDLNANPRILRGHDSAINTLAFSPDGRWLATGSSDATMRIWDMQNLDADSQILSEHEDAISTLTFSPDGRWLVSGSRDTTVRAWDMQDLNANPRVLRGHEGSINTLAFSPDGRWLATGSSDVTVRIWDAQNLGAARDVLRGHADIIFTLAFSPDGRWLATGGYDGTPRVWDMQDLSADPVVLHGHGSEIYKVVFNLDGRWLVTGSWDNTVRVWDMQNLSADPIILGPQSRFIMVSLALSPDGRWLATGSFDGLTRVWNMQDLNATPLILLGHVAPMNTMTFSPDGRWLVTGDIDASARLWDMQSLRADVVDLRGHEKFILTLAVSPDGRWLATGSGDTTVRVWDIQDLSAVPHILSGHEHIIDTVAFSPDGRWLATGSFDDAVRIWDMQDLNGDPIVLSEHKKGIATLTFSPDGRWLATGSYDATARVWDMQDLSADSHVLPGHTDGVRALAFSPDGRWLATGSLDATAQVWDMQDLNATPRVLKGHEQSILTLAFSPDGRWLATGGGDGTARVWDMQDLGADSRILGGHTDTIMTLAFSPQDGGRWLATGSADTTAQVWDMQDLNANPHVLRGHEAGILEGINNAGGISMLAFSPDGRRLATGGYDDTVRLWNMQDLDAAPVVLREHEGNFSNVGDIYALAFSPDGHRLVTGGYDAIVRVWNMNLEAIDDIACRYAGRNFTHVEWAQHFGNEPYRQTCEQWPEGK